MSSIRLLGIGKLAGCDYLCYKDCLPKPVFLVREIIVLWFILFDGALLYSSLQKRYKNKKTIKYLVRVGKYFGSGARTVHAMRQTSFHQVLLVGDYLKEIVISAFKIIMYGIVSLALLILLRDYWIASPFIIGITGVLCGVEFKRLREFILIYRQMFEYVYGEEYFKSEMEGIKQHWDTLKKK